MAIIPVERAGHEPGEIIRRFDHFVVPNLQTTPGVRREHESAGEFVMIIPGCG